MEQAQKDDQAKPEGLREKLERHEAEHGEQERKALAERLRGTTPEGERRAA